MLLPILQVLAAAAPAVLKLYAAVVVLLLARIFLWDTDAWYDRLGLEKIPLATEEMYDTVPVIMLVLSMLYTVVKVVVTIILNFFVSVWCKVLKLLYSIIGNIPLVGDIDPPEYCAQFGWTKSESSVVGDAVSAAGEWVSGAASTVADSVSSAWDSTFGSL